MSTISMYLQICEHIYKSGYTHILSHIALRSHLQIEASHHFESFDISRVYPDPLFTDTFIQMYVDTGMDLRSELGYVPCLLSFWFGCLILRITFFFFARIHCDSSANTKTSL